MIIPSVFLGPDFVPSLIYEDLGHRSLGSVSMITMSNVCIRQQNHTLSLEISPANPGGLLPKK